MYKIETSFAFPLIKLNTLVTYTQVKKPSGISYFLLVLINESSDRSVKISSLLKQFGVPEDLHELFADEIQKLLKMEIILSNYGYNKSYFEEYTLDAFSFTSKGRKVFLDEAIPLDTTNEIKQNIYYNPALNQLNILVDRPYGNIENSIFNDDFFKQLMIPDIDIVEEYLNSIKNNGIIIKKEEIIITTQILGFENNFITYPITIILSDDDAVSFEFEEPKLKSFFEKYYSKNMITGGILAKRKFKFPNEEQLSTTLSKEIPFSNIFVPEDINRLMNQKSMIDICSESYLTSNGKFSYKSNNIIGLLSEGAAFIKVFDLLHASIYIPVVITASNSIFGEIDIKLLIEKKLDSSQINTIVNEVIVFHTEFIENDEQEFSYKKLVQLCKFGNKIYLVNQKIDSWISELDLELKIALLGKIRDKSSNEPIIYDHVKKKGLELFDEYLLDTDLSSIENKLVNASWIIKTNKISNAQLINKIVEIDKINKSDSIALFDVMERLNFEYDDIFTYQKEIIPLFFKKNNSVSRISNQIRTLNGTLQSLKEITKISNPTNYAIKDIQDKDEFIGYFKTFKSSIDYLSFLRKYDDSLFIEYSQFFDIFSKLNDLYTIEKNAMGNPKAINEKLIEAKINNGDILSAVVNLYVKLSFLCKTKFNINKGFVDMINELEKRSYINTDETNLLHNFRIYRNDLEHANIIKKTLEISDLQKVTGIIFRLEEQVNELF